MKTNKLLIVITLLLLPCIVFSQALIKKGDKAFGTKKFKTALNYYKKAENKGDDSPQTKEKIAQCYFFTDNKEKAYEYFQQIKTEDLSENSIYIYGVISQKQGKYKEAIALLETAQTNNSALPGIEKLLTFCKWAQENNTPVDKVETNITDVALNGASMGVQFWDNKIVFSAVPDNTPTNQKNKMDLFYASYANGEFGRSFMLDNTFLYPLREGGIAFSNGGNIMYFSKEEPVGKGQYVFKIYSAEFNGSRWKNVQPLNFNNNQYSCAFPTISSNGKTIIFSSNMPGGKGGFDLWIASENNGQWGTAVNLKQLNTPGNEIYPFIDEENYLYFSSDGHPGFGGLDIFVSPNNGGRWDEIINLLRPINSPMDDFSFVINPQSTNEGLLLSDKAANSSEVHLYEFKLDRNLLASKMNSNNKTTVSTTDKNTNKVNVTTEKTNNTTKIVVNNTNTKKYSARKEMLLKKYNVKSESELSRDERQDFSDELNNPEKYKPANANNNNKETEVELTDTSNNLETTTQEVIFKVQILSSRQPIKSMDVVEGYEPKRYFFKEMYRYTIGSFENVDDAILLQERVVHAGFHDAFVAAFEKKTLKRLPDYVIYKDR